MLTALQEKDAKVCNQITGGMIQVIPPVQNPKTPASTPTYAFGGHLTQTEAIEYCRIIVNQE